MKNKHEVIIKIENKEWKDAIKKSFEKNKKDVNVDGFRKGKVPYEVFIKKMGIEALFMDAIDFAMPNAYSKALEESKLIPVTRPNVNVKNVNEEFVEIAFDIITKPEIKLGDYKNLNIKKEEAKVTKEEIKNEIEKLQNQYIEMQVKENGTIENGDTAVIDFEGFKDNVAFEGGKGENYPLEIGSNSFIPGFEEQLIGMKNEEEKEIEVTFPKEYPAEDLKGKKVVFKVKIHEIKTKKMPSLDKDFFEDLGMENVDSKESLEKELEQKLKSQKDLENENKHIDDLLEAIGKNVEVEIPEAMISEETDRIYEQFTQTISMQGMPVEQYLKMLNKKESDLKNDMKEEANKRVLYRLLIEEISNVEKIEVTEEEANEKAEELAGKYNMKKEEFLKAFGGLDMVKYDAKMRKTFEFLKENN